MTDLLNCPFCGSETVENWDTWSGPECLVYCAECHAKGPRVMMKGNEKYQDFMDRVIAAWNTRTPDPAVQALVEALRFGVDLIEGDSFGAEWKRGQSDFRRMARAALAAFDKTD